MEPVPFTLEIGLTLAVAAARSRCSSGTALRVDVVGLMVMASLILLGLVTPQEGISGFANEATVTVAAMFVLSAGLLRTGAIDILGRWVARLAGKSEFRLLVVACLLVIPMSAFINNTPVVVVMIPMILGLTREMGRAVAPLHAHLVREPDGRHADADRHQHQPPGGRAGPGDGLDRIRLFDITPPALVLTAIGVAYLLTVGRWLTPTRETAADLISGTSSETTCRVLVVEPESSPGGPTLRQASFGETHGLEVIGIDREGTAAVRAGPAPHRGRRPPPGPRQDPGHRAHRGARPPPHRRGQAGRSRAGKAGRGRGNGPAAPHLAELIVPPRSPLIGGTVRSIGFRGRYGVPVLGIQRHGEPLQDALVDIPLRAGDLLLVQGTDEELQKLHRGGDLALLGPVEICRPGAVARSGSPERSWCRRPPRRLRGDHDPGVRDPRRRRDVPDPLHHARRGVREVDWMVLILLGSIIPLGIAMQNTGTAHFIAANMLLVTEPLGLYGVARRVLPAHLAADGVDQQQRRGRGADAGRDRHGRGARRLPDAARDRRDDRRVEQLHDADRLPDEHLHLRPRRLPVRATSSVSAARST
jgi:di/tricarboxylate transporter